MDKNNNERKISLLDWGIVLSSLLMLLTIFIPPFIWDEENRLKKEGRKRMSDISHAQDFYFELTGHYTLDGKHLFKLVEAAMDSLIADSLFIGDQVINLEKKSYPINLDRGFEIRVDTTFSDPSELYFSYKDTIYSVGMRNLESGGTDTIFVNVRDLSKYYSNKNFQNIINSDVVTRSEIRTDYLRKKYHLDDSLLFCPITRDPYIFKMDSIGEEAVFEVISPLHLLEKPYKESRFLFFKFYAGDHGYIRGGQTSWAN